MICTGVFSNDDNSAFDESRKSLAVVLLDEDILKLSRGNAHHRCSLLLAVGVAWHQREEPCPSSKYFPDMGPGQQVPFYCPKKEAALADHYCLVSAYRWYWVRSLCFYGRRTYSFGSPLAHLL